MLRTLTFGDLDTGIWGVSWDLGEGHPGFALAGDRRGFVSVGTGFGELEVSSSGEPSQLTDGFDELVAVKGNVAEYGIECLGRRGQRDSLDPMSCESIRDVSAWFSVDEGLALLAARPGGTKGHGDDVVSASLFESGHPLPVEDPRLSTTYAAGGSPVSAGVEMWVESEEPGVDGAEPHVVHYPRRAAGEATADGAAASAGALSLQARPFVWHAHGHEGAGVYVLVRVG